jgi:hypothetical protein
MTMPPDIDVLGVWRASGCFSRISTVAVDLDVLVADEVHRAGGRHLRDPLGQGGRRHRPSAHVEGGLRMEHRRDQLAVAPVDTPAVAHQRIVNLRLVQQRAKFGLIKLRHHTLLTHVLFPAAGYGLCLPATRTGRPAWVIRTGGTAPATGLIGAPDSGRPAGTRRLCHARPRATSHLGSRPRNCQTCLT